MAANASSFGPMINDTGSHCHGGKAKPCNSVVQWVRASSIAHASAILWQLVLPHNLTSGEGPAVS